MHLARSHGWPTCVEVTLLGVRVSACTVINRAEHRRRETAGMGAVVSAALLDRLMDAPIGVPVVNRALWLWTVSQPPGVLERGEDGANVVRRLESPLLITDVVVRALAGRELRAVQDASLFAGFTRRWASFSRVPEAALLEAKMCGVGIVGPGDRVLLAAEKPVARIRDGWSWLLEEQAYRRWLASGELVAAGARRGGSWSSRSGEPRSSH